MHARGPRTTRVDHARWWRGPRTLVARTSADHCAGMDDNTCARVLVSLANGHYPSRIIDEAAYVRATLAHHRVELAAQREVFYIMSDTMLNGHGEYLGETGNGKPYGRWVA